jgi:hypothetical protein
MSHSLCIANCGRKKRPNSRYCLQCEDRQIARAKEQGRYNPRRVRLRDFDYYNRRVK